MIDLPSDWSYDLPPTAEQQRLDRQMERLDRQMERLDRFGAFRLSPREWWAAIGTAALVMSLGYVLCQLQIGSWDWPAPGHLWQAVVDFVNGYLNLMKGCSQ